MEFRRLKSLLLLVFIFVCYTGCPRLSRAEMAAVDVGSYQTLYPERAGRPIVLKNPRAEEGNQSFITLWDGNGAHHDRGSWITLTMGSITRGDAGALPASTTTARAFYRLVLKDKDAWWFFLNPNARPDVDQVFFLGSEQKLAPATRGLPFPNYATYRLNLDLNDPVLPTVAFYRPATSASFAHMYLWQESAWKRFEYYTSIFQTALLTTLGTIDVCLIFLLIFGMMKRISFASFLITNSTLFYFLTQWHYIKLSTGVVSILPFVWLGSCFYYGLTTFSTPMLFVPVFALLLSVIASLLNIQFTHLFNPFFNDMITYGFIAVTAFVAFFAALYYQNSARVIPFFFTKRRSATPASAAPLAKIDEELMKGLQEDSGLWVYHLSANRVHFSKEIHHLLKGEFSVGDVSKQEWDHLVYHSDRALIETSMRACLETKSPTFTLYFRCCAHNGSLIWVRLDGGVILDANHQPIQIQGLLLDITEHKEQQDKAAQQGLYDSLTQLPAKALFLDRLTYRLEQVSAQQLIAVVVINFEIDPMILLQIGSSGENTLITVLAQRIQECVIERGILARLSGASFALAIPCAAEKKEELIEQIRLLNPALSKPVALQNVHISSIKPSFGVTFCKYEPSQESSGSSGSSSAPASPSQQDAENFLKEAELASFLANRPRFDNLVIFEPSLRQSMMLRWDIATEIEKGLSLKQFELVYQPVFQSADKGAKKRPPFLMARLQWHHPRRGVLTSRDFIPPLGEDKKPVLLALFKFTLQQAKECSRKLNMPVFLDILTSLWAEEAHREELLDLLAQEDHHFVHLLIPEMMMAQNPEHMTGFLRLVKKVERGSSNIRLALTRFTGGNLSFLTSHLFDYVQPDNTFIQDVSRHNREAVAALVSLLHHLDKKLIFGQVTTQERLELGISARFDFVSGPLLAAFMQPKEIVECFGVSESA